MVTPKGSMSTVLSTRKKTWRDSVPIDMLLSAVSVLVVAQPSSEVPDGLMNYPVYLCHFVYHIPSSSVLFLALICPLPCSWHTPLSYIEPVGSRSSPAAGEQPEELPSPTWDFLILTVTVAMRVKFIMLFLPSTPFPYMVTVLWLIAWWWGE